MLSSVDVCSSPKNIFSSKRLLTLDDATSLKDYKIKQMRDLITEYNRILLALTETWLNNSILNIEVNIHGIIFKVKKCLLEFMVELHFVLKQP